ncbi:hypothetical protein AP1_0432 [Aeromonas phage AP1]|nr:hypothetical protein AP1_0432 [Aeromonas phage AP1]
MTDPDTGLEHTTPETYLVGIAETRKQRQLQAKKFGASKHDHDIEDLTGQPTGDSKAGGISNPEIQVLLSLGLKTMAKELADVRGGDIGAYQAYKNDIISGGETTVQSLKREHILELSAYIFWRRVVQRSNQRVFFVSQELVIPVVFKPLAQSGFNHTEVDYSSDLVEGNVVLTKVLLEFDVDLGLNLEVKHIVVTVQMTALALVPYYAVTGTNLVRANYRIRHFRSPIC